MTRRRNTLLALGLATGLAGAAFAQSGHHHGAGAGHGTSAQAQSEATKSYMAAMGKMHGPMMQGVQDASADVAFVKGMIPHHQGAIEMAKIVLAHGKDEELKKMAQKVIDDQTMEIGEMQAWLKQHGR